jgi:uroporphyrinogen-III synthase
MRILVTRPIEDATQFAQALEARGHTPLISPVLEIEQVPGPQIDLSRYRAILVTSANAARALGARTPDRAARILCVGTASAGALQRLGFVQVLAAPVPGANGLAQLAMNLLAPRGGPVAYMSGEDVSGDLMGALASRGFTVDRHILYKAVTVPQLARVAASALSNNQADGVTFFSKRSLASFIDLTENAGLGAVLADLPAFCLSQHIAQAAASKFKSVAHAREPSLEAMLEIIGNA